MKWFGRKAAPAPARAVLARVGYTGGDWPPAYQAQVREGYAGNAVVNRAVRLVTQGLARAPLACSDPAIAALLAGRSDGQGLLETAGAQLLLHGNAYLQLLRGEDGRVAELFALRPDRVSVEPDARGWPAAYAYRVGEQRLRLLPDGPQPEIVHIKAFHPLDDHYGLGCLAPAAGAIAVHNATARWNKALLDNAARPSGALVYDPGDGSVLTREQFERLREEIAAGFAGEANAGRPMLLEGGMRWQALSLTPADMDFTSLKAAAAREIACAFGVPPMLLGLPGDATYANYREANRALWRQAILPLAEMLFAPLAQALAGWFAGASIRVDLDQVSELAEDRERLWRQVSAADFLSPQEKRAMLGIGEVQS